MASVSSTMCLTHKPALLPIHCNLRSRTCLNLGGLSLFGLECLPKLKLRQPLLVCAAGGKGMGSEDGGSLWEAFNKAMETFKGPSIENVLKQQIEKNEYYEEDGGSGKPPGGKNTGDGGRGGSEDGGFGESVDEAIQVLLAVIGLVFMYAYILSGDYLIRLARDYVKYLFGAKKSVRLRRVMYSLGEFYKKSTKKKVVNEYWLEKAILRTQTWWDGPEKYRHILTRTWWDLPKESRHILRSLGLDLGKPKIQKKRIYDPSTFYDI